ncbi:MAG: PDC sensor domain-containing protein, partial [Gemmatimonadales bacterium]
MTITSNVRLRTRLIALGLVATAPALIVILYTQSLDRERARQSAATAIRQVTQLAASEQATVFDGVQRLLLTLAKLPDVLSDDQAHCRALLPGILRDHPAYVNIWISKTSDPAFCEAIPVGPEVNAGNATRTWYRRAVATGTTAVGDFTNSPVNGMPQVVVAHPITGPSGAFEGVVAAAISLGTLNDIAAHTPLPPGTTLTLIDRQRRILARYPDGLQWVGRMLPAATPDGSMFATAPVQGNVDTGLQ